MVFTFLSLSFRGILLCEFEIEGLELLIAVEVALEMLKKHHLLVN